MSYVAVPASGASIPANDQPQINANFTSIKSAWDVNHVDFNASGAGKHNLITFPVQSSAPSVTLGDIAIFSEASTLTLVNELFITNSIGTTYPLTADDAATTGWAYWPGGILVKWGITSGTGDTIVTFPVAATIPVFNTVIYSRADVQQSNVDNNRSAAAVVATTTTLEVYVSFRTTTGAATANFNYFVMGT